MLTESQINKTKRIMFVLVACTFASCILYHNYVSFHLYLVSRILYLVS